MLPQQRLFAKLRHRFRHCLIGTCYYFPLQQFRLMIAFSHAIRRSMPWSATVQVVSTLECVLLEKALRRPLYASGLPSCEALMRVGNPTLESNLTDVMPCKVTLPQFETCKV